MACPEGNGVDGFACVEGACKLVCGTAFGTQDCDGLTANGCESTLIDPSNCGGCGIVCDPGVLCMPQLDPSIMGCGCSAGTTQCGSSCVDTATNRYHCGACGNECDPTGGPGAPQYAHAFYGCSAGECLPGLCEKNYANCDGDLENGCETKTVTNENCGGCGIACAPGQQCVLDGEHKPFCACGDGLAFCPAGEQDGVPVGGCQDLKTSTGYCGGCSINCWNTMRSFNEIPACDYGQCVINCASGFANCNGAESDGCEVDTKSDPRNCGGCGVSCDLSIGQACVAGKCVVAPCDQIDAGTVTR